MKRGAGVAMASDGPLPIRSELVIDALDYITEHWHTLTRTSDTDKGTLLTLPHPYIVPAITSRNQYPIEEQYYWDTFFIILGLQDKKYKKLAQGMIENLAAMYERFGLIPKANRMYFTSRSQPPLLTTMIDTFREMFGANKDWYESMMALAEDEYNTVWMGTAYPNWRKVGPLNRYYNINGLHDFAEAESGWSMTPRFGRKCLDFYPIDLNALLYKYEKDFADYYRKKGQNTIARRWETRATERAHAVNELLWSDARDFYFDYNFVEQERGYIWSLAGYFTMWAEMVDGSTAKLLVRQLDKFERAGGLTTTTVASTDLSVFGSVKTQWAYPNGWAPLHWFVIKGLENYGYRNDARRIARKWLSTNLQWFEKHREFIDKYNVVSPGRLPADGMYPHRSGFGWTNGVFVDLIKDYT